MQTENERRLLVFYLGVGAMSEAQVSDYVMKVKRQLFSPEFLKNNNCEIIILPSREVNSRIECINPIYITDAELIKQHEDLMRDVTESVNKITVEGSRR